MAGVTYALRYDLLNDFEPVAMLSTYAYVLVARKTMPANELNGLVAWLRALRTDPDEEAFDACTDNTGARANAFFCS